MNLGVGYKRGRLVFLATVLILANLVLNPSEIRHAQAATSCTGNGLDLGTAGNFSVLAPVITLAGSTLMNSAIGAHSFAEATGQAEVTDPAVQKHFGDETYTAAISDLALAIDCALSWSSEAIPFNDPSHLTFTPGTYIQTAVEATTAATSVITLDAQNNPDAVFIFLFPGNFTPGASVNMLGGAKPENVFWVMAGDFTLGAASSIWKGNVLSGRNITLGGSDILFGRVLARTAVTTSANIIDSPKYTTRTVHSSWIEFSDHTLESITAGIPYVDAISAHAVIDGQVSSATITYSVDANTPLPSGLSLDTTSGGISGTLPESTSAGDFNLNFMAFTSSISSPPVVAVLKVKAAPIKSIFFTDITLVDATIGTFYSDTATAEAQIGGTPSGALITYSVDTSTPLPKGLSLNGLTGVVSGALPDSSTVETRTVIIVAFSAGYPPQSLSYKFLIMAKTSPPVDTGSSTPPVDTGSSSLISKLSDITTAVPGETNTVTLEMETQTLLAEATELLISNLPSANDVISVEEVVINKPTAALMMTALFSNNSSNLDSKTQKAIIKMALSMKNMNIETITAVGFTNSAGGTDNLKLATARAKSVAKVLTDAGIKIKIAIKSVGITKNATSKEAMIKMRKAEIWVLLKAQETNKVITEE